MKVFYFFVVLIVLGFSPLVFAQQNPVDAEIDNFFEKTGEKLSDDLVYKNIESLAGSSCDLYGLGIDLVNIAYDDQWNIIDSMVGITVLFRNQPWREIIWSISDQREQFLKDLTALKKERCVWSFAESEALGKNRMDELRKTLTSLDRKISELQAKIDYFAVQRRNMLFDYPWFGDFRQLKKGDFFVPEIPTDKIFYFLGGLTSFKVNWSQFIIASKSVLSNVREDLDVIISDIPDDCFAVVTVGHELDMYFAYRFSYVDGVYKDDEGNEYKDFQSFVKDNGAKIAQNYIKKYCSSSRSRALAESEKSSAEQQLQRFLDVTVDTLDILGLRLIDMDKAVLVLEKKKEISTLSDEESETLSSMYSSRGRLLAMIDYQNLLLQEVGSSESQSLDKLAESLSRFSEAVLGVISDSKGRKKSRLSFAERFQYLQEKNLQKICSRIEKMYKKAGRSTADLPFIQQVNGKRYCRATTKCADVGIGNLIGGSEGRKKLAECSGFLFDSSELGPSQFTKDVIDQSSEDISVLLEQRAFNDLLKQRNLHFASLRNRYDALYSAQNDTTALLEQILQETTLDLYDPTQPDIYSPSSGKSKSHFSLLGKIYKDFWKFTSKQGASCSAPEKPVF